MTAKDDTDVKAPDDRVLPAMHNVKQNRNCMRCTLPFESRGFGERICPKCKRSTGYIVDQNGMI